MSFSIIYVISSSIPSSFAHSFIHATSNLPLIMPSIMMIVAPFFPSISFISGPINIVRFSSQMASSSSLPPPPLLPLQNNASSSTIIPPSAIWIGDLLFRRSNRSLKYAQDGSLLIMSNSVEWSDIGHRLIRSFGWFLLFALAIVLNFLVLFLSMKKTRQQAYHQKFQFLLGSLAVCNALIALGLLVYSFLIDVFYEVDSFDTLLQLTTTHFPLTSTSLWQFAKFLIHTELVENCFIAQQLILLLASLDRYLTLFDWYPTNAKPIPLFVAIAALPFLLAMVPLDKQLLQIWLSEQIANLIRLLSLLCPLLLSVVLSGCSLIGLVQQRQLLQRVFGPTLFRDQLSLGLSIFGILCVDLIAKFGLFLELLGANFSLQITIDGTDQQKTNGRVQTIIHAYYSLAHFLLMLSPLLHPLVTLTFVGFYRRRASTLVRQFFHRRRNPKLDYASETMRSIIADQIKARQMRTAGICWRDEGRGTETNTHS